MLFSNWEKGVIIGKAGRGGSLFYNGNGFENGEEEDRIAGTGGRNWHPLLFSAANSLLFGYLPGGEEIVIKMDWKKKKERRRSEGAGSD